MKCIRCGEEIEEGYELCDECYINLTGKERSI